MNTKDLHPGLGSGALREAQQAAYHECLKVIRMFTASSSLARRIERDIALLADTAGEKLSLSNPIEPPREIDPHSPGSQAIIEKWLIAYQKGEAKVGDCKGILDRLCAPPQSSEIREAVDKLKAELDHLDGAEYIINRTVEALAPSRQGAAKRVEG